MSDNNSIDRIRHLISISNSKKEVRNLALLGRKIINNLGHSSSEKYQDIGFNYIDIKDKYPEEINIKLNHNKGFCYFLTNLIKQLEISSNSINSIGFFMPINREPNIINSIFDKYREIALPIIKYGEIFFSKVYRRYTQLVDSKHITKEDITTSTIYNRLSPQILEQIHFSKKFKSILEPKEIIPNCHLVPKVVIVPGLCMDRTGNRLGYGGGYYDRFFLRNPNCIKIGICSKNMIFTEIKSKDKWDLKLDWIVTEDKIIEV